MGITERREREKAERRKAILDCARELILLHGVERVSIEDIACKAELSKATLYLYFPGKEILFNEICEDASRVFLENFMPFLGTGSNSIDTLKRFWNGFVNMFGSSDEIFIVFQVRNFLNPGQPFITMEEQKSPYGDAIIGVIKNIIDQCKAEGVFDPDLDSVKATRLLLLMFSVIIDNIVRMPVQDRKSPAIIEEIKTALRIIIRGFASDGIDRKCLDMCFS